MPTPDPDGTTPPKGWTQKHAAFLEAWAADNPRGSARQAESDMRVADLGTRGKTIRDQLKAIREGASRASGTHGDAPDAPTQAEGAAVRPVHVVAGRRDAPVAECVPAVRPDADPVPAVSGRGGVRSGGGVRRRGRIG